MRNLAATMLATVALAMGAPGLSLAVPLAAGLDRAIAAAPAGGQIHLVNGEPRRTRVTTVRRSDAAYLYSFYPRAAVSYGAVVGGGYPYYYVPNGYPYYYAGQYWPRYYGRYRYPGYDYSPFAFFGYRASDFQ
jgi:hypothetical protein